VRKLNQRLGEIGIGVFIGPEREKLFFEDLVQLIEDECDRHAIVAPSDLREGVQKLAPFKSTIRNEPRKVAAIANRPKYGQS